MRTKGIGVGDLYAWQREALEGLPGNTGNAFRTERDRRVKCAQDPTTQDTPMYKDIYREKRYAKGGTHERLARAAKAKAK